MVLFILRIVLVAGLFFALLTVESNTFNKSAISEPREKLTTTATLVQSVRPPQKKMIVPNQI